MLGVVANNHYFAFSFNDFALLANFLYGWLYLHLVIPFLSSRLVLLSTPCDTAFAGVINRDLNRYLIARQYLNIVHSQLTRNMSRYDILIRELYLEGRVRHCFHNYAFKFDYVILWQNNPSIPSDF